MDTSKLTFKKFFDALTPSQAFAIATSCVVAAVFLFELGNRFGQIHTESADAQKLVELAGNVTQHQVDLSLARDQVAKLTQSELQLVAANKAANSANEGLRQQSDVTQLRAVGRSNCDFIHKQIRATQDEIVGIRSPDVFSGGGGSTEEVAERAATLEQRITKYQEQLRNCALKHD